MFLKESGCKYFLASLLIVLLFSSVYQAHLLSGAIMYQVLLPGLFRGLMVK